MDWFRSYHGAPTNQKWRVVARRAGVRAGDVAAVVWYLFDRASQSENRGSIAGYDAEEIAVSFDYEVEEVEKIVAALREKGVITPDDRLTTWDEHQPKREDGSAERAKAWREQKKQERTQANAGERERPLEKIREEKITVPNGTGGAPPAGDSLKALFDFGVSVLTQAGDSEKEARSIVGKWRKDLGDDGKLMNLLMTARKNYAIAPKPYLLKAVKQEAERSRRGGISPMPSPAGG